jgi:hypothetical protein
MHVAKPPLERIASKNRSCGRICLHRKKINISTVLAGQRLGIKEVDDGIWLVSFMHYDLGYIDSSRVRRCAAERRPGSSSK